MSTGSHSEAQIIAALKQLEGGGRRRMWRASATPTRQTPLLKKGAEFSGSLICPPSMNSLDQEAATR